MTSPFEAQGDTDGNTASITGDLDAEPLPELNGKPAGRTMRSQMSTKYDNIGLTIVSLIALCSWELT